MKTEIIYIDIMKLFIFTNLFLQLAGFILNIKICISLVQLHLLYSNICNATWMLHEQKIMLPEQN